MTSAARTNKPQRGFTLIEIVMVLALAAVVMGSAIGLVAYSSDERILRKTSGEIELMAKQARMLAILHQTPYALEFSESGIHLLPLAQASADQKGTSLSHSPPVDPGTAAPDESRQLTLESGMTLSVRRWNTDVLINLEKNSVQIWRFDPDGLCEPLAVHLVYGKSWSEDTYHPLTATINDSQFETR